MVVCLNSTFSQNIRCRKPPRTNRYMNDFSNHYYKSHPIGKGGFSKVFKTIQNKSFKEFACKTFDKNELKDNDYFYIDREVHIHSELDHPYIVKYHDIKEDDWEINLITEYCSNGTFKTIVDKLNETEKFRYAIQILEAIEYLHDGKIIHRDIKMENIFLDKDLNPKLGDFGLSCHFSDNQYEMIGTVNYIAPEIVENYEYDYRADIWSFGVLLYRIFIGSHPFYSCDAKTTLTLIERVDYSFPKMLEIREDVKDLIADILQHNPNKRPSLTDIKIRLIRMSLENILN